MVLHIKKVMLVLLVAMLLLSCGSGVRDVGSSVPDVESMDFNHEVYTGEFFYSERNLQGRDYVINLKDIKYEKQNLTTVAQAVDYMITVMADEGHSLCNAQGTPDLVADMAIKFFTAE